MSQDTLKTLAASLLGLFTLASLLCKLTGYTPPTELLNIQAISPEQLILALAVVSQFLQPLHKTLGDVINIARNFFATGKVTDEALAALVTDLAAQKQALADVQAQLSNVKQLPAPVSQAGFISPVVLSILICGAVIMSLLPGCSTTQVQKAQTDVQRVQVVLQQACPSIQATLTTVGVLELSPQGAIALKGATDAATAVCAAGNSAKVADLRTLANDALPKLDAAVKASSLPADKQTEIIVGLGVVNSLINQALTTLQSSTPEPAASAASS